jgi:hypothetical protein
MTHHPNQQRDQHVARWRSTSISRAAYCREHHIAYHTFLSWIKHSMAAGSTTAPAGFIEVLRPSVHANVLPAPPVASVSFPSGVMMRFLVGADANWIGRVVAAVQSC